MMKREEKWSTPELCTELCTRGTIFAVGGGDLGAAQDPVQPNERSHSEFCQVLTHTPPPSTNFDISTDLMDLRYDTFG